MIALAFMSAGLAAAMAIALVALAARIRESAGMEVHPAWKSRLLESGLASAEAILSLPGLSVSGHAFRHVRRVVLDPATGRRAYLKVEQRVRWKDRIRSWLDGLGLASLSLREARILRMLENEGLPGPGWIAFGSDGAGRSFLLIPESPAVELGVFIAEDRVSWRRRRAAIRLGRALARMHASGVNHPDLYAKHVLVDPETGEPTLLDWQRSRRAPVVSFNARLRDLATLQATISGQLVSDELRGALLRSYLRESRRKAGCLWGGFSRPCREPYDPGDFTREERHWLRHPELERLAASRIEAITGQMLAKRHVREKRQATSRAPGLDWTASPDGDLIVSSAWLEAGLDPESPARRRLAGALEGQSAAAVSVLEPLDLGDNHLALLSARISSGHSGISPWRSAEKKVANLWNRLHKHAVPGPRVLAVGRQTLADGREASYLVLEPRPALASLADWLATSAAGPADRQSVLSGAGAVLARLHAAGCRLSREPHPLGVALDDGSPVVVVQPWGVRPPSRLAKFAIRTDLGSLSRELAAAGTNPDELDWIQAGYFDEMGHIRALPRHGGPDDARGGVFMGYRDDSPGPAPAFQAIGDGRASIWRRWFQGIWHGVQASSWTRFAGQDWHRSIMDRDLRDRYHTKQGRSIARWSLPDPQGGPNLVVYVKRHHLLPRWQGLLACLLPRGRWSPALQEWQHLDWASRQGVPVPRPVAASEYLAPGGKLSSCLIIEELTGMLPTHEAIPKAARSLAPRAFRRFKRGLAREMARLTRLLHDRSCFHKDLYLCHFYIHEADIARPPEDWRGKVFMIDLHRLGRHPLTAPLWQLKDLAQLAYSSEVEGMEPVDRVAFWRAYRRPGTSSWWTRWLMRAVLVKWRRYRAHNLKHRGRRPGADRKAA
jgi:heptose I phosphotransferase